MPHSKELTSWEGDPQWRWRKMYRGRKVVITCKELGLPRHQWTKNDSYPHAILAWRKRKAEIDAEDHLDAPPPLPLEGFLRDVAEELAEQQRLDREAAPQNQPAEERARARDESRPAEERRPRVRNWVRVLDPYTAQVQEVVEQYGIRGRPLPPDVAEKHPQIAAALNTIKGESAPAERSVGGLCARWVELQWKRATAGELTSGWAANTEDCLKRFRDHFGEGTDIEQAMTETGLDNFYLFCREKMQVRLTDPQRKAGWSADYAKKVFDIARRFVRGVWELKLADVTLPRNIDSKRYLFNVAAREVQAWTAEEFKTVLAAAQTWRQMPLHLLLMANCGYRHKDISDLEQGEVDWKHGRIIRVRSKLADLKSAAKVNYQLWPVTFELLQKHRNPDLSRHAPVLLTESGNRWVWEKQGETADGKVKLRSSNNIDSNFTHLRKRIGFDKPLSLIRKMGATLLNSSKEHRACVQEYLGESPTSIKDRHYVRPDQGHFDAAIEWLGRQLGQV